MIGLRLIWNREGSRLLRIAHNGSLLPVMRILPAAR
jgi:hypothetical protein